MGDINVVDGSVLRLRSDSKLTLNADSALTIKSIDKVKNIEPVAVHLKEVNHIDPLTIEALHVSEVKNIEPLQIAKFNVTNLPMVNVSLQKLPEVGINIKTLPPISVGIHQDFCIPSSYTLHARLLGIEVARLQLNGQTSIIPRERARREQARADNKSYPAPSVAGNPAIPSHCSENVQSPCCTQPGHAAGHYRQPPEHAAPHPGAGAGMPASIFAAGLAADPSMASLSFGIPRAAFQVPNRPAADNFSENRIMSGE
ncbi:MAG: hypothetical protein EPN14_09330 [Gallionella sp.]|nr:MAG: hypothetical protein EPN14_09330 [Gallionella sp.]